MSIVYRVNTKTKEIIKEKLSKEYETFGNRGLIAKVMTDEVDPKCDPMGAENKLVIATGNLAGTTAPCAHRLSVGAKSPLTGTIKESNVGGTVAYYMAQHGIKMFILEDLPTDDEWYFLKVEKDSSVQLISAEGYVGLNNYKLVEKLQEKYGKNVSILSIGIAGERQYKIASLQCTCFTTNHPVRSAARGGLGAVFGSKKIKAIIVEKAMTKQEFQYANKSLFSEGVKQFIAQIGESPFTSVVFPTMGTPGFTDFTAAAGILPVRNFNGELFESEKLDNVNSKAFLAKIAQNNGKTGIPCQPGCIIKCSNAYYNDKKEFVTSGLEYETIALCGPNCDIDDFDVIAEFDRISDDIGVDTIEVGNMVAICMEAGKIAWGDKEAAISLVRELYAGTEFGLLLGQGTDAVGNALGVKRIPTTKKQAFAAYDPRNLKGIGVTYATTPMGADHTAGNTFGAPVDPIKKEGQVAISAQMQIGSALADNFTCSFAFSAVGGNFDNVVNMMAGAFGGEWDAAKVLAIGKETLQLEIAFNRAAGFTPEDDKLPEFLYKEKSPAFGNAFDLTPDEIAEIYSLII